MGRFVGRDRGLLHCTADANDVVTKYLEEERKSAKYLNEEEAEEEKAEERR